MTALGTFLFFVFPALLILAAIYDLFSMTIPNKLSGGLAALFPLAALIAGFDAVQIGWHALAGLGVLMICFVMFARGWIGGGDAKFAAATALWIGPSVLLAAWALQTAIFGGVLTIVLLGLRRIPLPVALSGQDWIVRLHSPKTGIPYGIALAAAGVAIYPAMELFSRLSV